MRIVAHRILLWRIKEAVVKGRMVEIDVMAYDNSPRDEL
jgi:hypothetical protein